MVDIVLGVRDFYIDNIAILIGNGFVNRINKALVRRNIKFSVAFKNFLVQIAVEADSIVFYKFLACSIVAFALDALYFSKQFAK